MDLKAVKEFIKLAKEEGVSELKYETKEQKISVAFEARSPAQPAFPAHVQTAVPEASQKTAGERESLHEVKSPFVGTFYAASGPDKPAYVKVGDRVSAGQILCILEAMKIMNEIESDVSGEIAEICVENESLVEYGQTLFKLRV